MKKYEQIFLGQDGNSLLNGNPDNFSEYFDWVILQIHPNIPPIIRKNNQEPKTIYIKTDFLKYFSDSIMDKIHNKFILITAASDFSPQVSWKNYDFKKYYKKIIENPNLVAWYTNNLRTKEDKIFSLPCGIGAGKYWNGCTPKDVDDLILNVRNLSSSNDRIKDKIFCSFKESFFNVCGEDMFIRPKIKEIIRSNGDLFDFYDEYKESTKENFYNFLINLSRYKYALCPHGNGMDPSPTAWIALALGTIPVIYKTPNSFDMFGKTDSVVFFENFYDITDKNLYQDRNSINFDFLTCEYWANKIKLHL